MKVKVTQGCIDKGVKQDICKCPIALSLKKNFPEAKVGCGITLNGTWTGEDFSYEIAGYDESGNSLMKRQGLGKLKKEYDLAGFSDPMDYKYGCKPKECREFVYKLDIVTNGVRKVQSWDHTVNRCAELGLQTVPELDRFVHVDVEETLNKVNKWLANDKMRASTIDSSHLIEGVCVRVEELDNMGFVKQELRVFKHKSFLFGVLEGYARENNEVEAEEIENQEKEGE